MFHFLKHEANNIKPITKEEWDQYKSAVSDKLLQEL